MRRTVATLLVVASPVLMAAPVGAREGPVTAPAAIQAAPAAVQAAVPGAVQAAVPAPVAVAPPTELKVTPAVPGPAAAIRPAVRAVRAKALAAVVDDTAYAAQLGADLCQARAIFCGLDRGGRYPAG